ncbi:hypothetical protein PIB30_064791 [Stylosanthes scabra]|uniref:Putative plant transposon protein domain-containing protein n=1 Tax=Stylosanthes scabra TaxID=79078 RepID=A0ABU6WLS8_9FABA|nr:hypothetical protein [Stylosanthes scabra]
MRFKRETAGAQTDYKTRQAVDQRLDEVLAGLCIQGVTWKLSLGQPAVPIQLRWTELHPLAKGWQEFIIHSLVPTWNKSEVTTARAILIHCILRGEEVKAEDIIADNVATIAQGLTNKWNLAYPSTIYKLCKDAGIPLREFRRTPRIPELSYITARRMEATRQEQERLAKEIQEVRKSQITQTLANNKRLETEKNMQLAIEKQGRDIVEMRKQLNLWTRNTSAREAYTCWDH